MNTRRIRRPQSIPNDPQPVARPLRDVPVQAGLPDVEKLSDELEEYVDVLLGRVPPPIEAGDLSLMEVADAYFARASEIQMRILEMEREGGTFRGSEYYKFRTGELRSFLELSKRAADLGSRRLTHQRLLFDMQAQDEGLEWSQ